MNEKFKQRLLGLIVVLVLLFALTWLLPRQAGDGDAAVPSTVVPLASVAAGASTGGIADNLGDAEGAPQVPPDERSPPVEAGQAASAAADAPAAPPSERMPAQPATPTVALPKPKPAPPAVAKVEKLAAPPPAPKVEKAAVPPPVAKVEKPAVSPPATAKTELPAPSTPSKASPPGPAAPAPTPPAVAAAVAKAAAAAPEAKVWYVQIGSFADQGNAQTTLSLLQNVGYRGEVAPAKGPSGNTLYRVRLGPFPTEALARAAQDKVAHQGYPQSRAVSEPTRVR